MDHESPEESEEITYGPPVPSDKGTWKLGPLVIYPRLSVWLIYGGIILFNLILIGVIVLIAFDRADKL